MPLIHPKMNTRNSSYQSQAKKSSNDQYLEQERVSLDVLPMLKINQILKKIGARDRNQQMFVPNEEDQASFRKSKLEQLNR